MVHLMRNLLIFNFKAVFHKIEKLVVATFYLKNNFLALLRNVQCFSSIKNCTNKMSPEICTCLILLDNCKNAVFFVTITAMTLGEKFLFIYTEWEHEIDQNIELLGIDNDHSLSNCTVYVFFELLVKTKSQHFANYCKMVVLFLSIIKLLKFLLLKYWK